MKNGRKMMKDSYYREWNQWKKLRIENAKRENTKERKKRCWMIDENRKGKKYKVDQKYILIYFLSTFFSTKEKHGQNPAQSDHQVLIFVFY